MKLLTIVIPCYNSSAYMEKAIDTAASGGDEVDVLVVNDGSRDDTAAVADACARKYPGIVRVIHQENGGHGAGVNQGIWQGQGLYLKVLDSDDRLDPQYMPGFLDLLRAHSTPETQVDLVVHDYVYDSADKQAFFRIGYRSCLAPGRAMTWDETKHFRFFNQFMIHCMVYRTAMLRDEMQLRLPHHVFYEDNLYIYQPLKYVKRVMYYDKPLHAYFIGRPDQSINKDVIIRRLNMVSAMAKQMICTYKLSELDALPRKLRRHMINSLAGQLSTACSVQLMAGEEGKRQYDQLRKDIQAFDPALWKTLRRQILGFFSTPNTAFGEKLLLFGYHTSRRMMHFE